MMDWEIVIGLEVHVQLATQSKIFSGAATRYGAEANRQACAVDLGLPGTLPVLNHRAVEFAIRFGLAIDAELNSPSIFARKHYFYPDLPKGYQISQYELPIVGKGHLDIDLADDQHKRIHITRAHLEEDAGKSLHDAFQGETGIDLNRAGTPLLEIVSEPDIRSSVEAVAYLKTLHTLVRHLGISDGNMQEGSFRCDVNLSVRPRGQTAFGTRTECKNLNSFRFIEKAIEYESERQILLLESGEAVVQETRLFNTNTGKTETMRSKEDAHDYRYFPDPDLLPVTITEQEINQIRSTLPELPKAKQQRYQQDYNLSADDARFLISTPALADFFEKTLAHCQLAKPAANWIKGSLWAYLSKHELDITQSPVTPEHLAHLIQRLEDDTLSSRSAKTVFEHLCQQAGSVDDIIEQHGLNQMNDDGALDTLIQSLIQQHPDQVKQYQAGKTKLLGFFVGQVMKATQGRANAAKVNKRLKEALATAD